MGTESYVLPEVIEQAGVWSQIADCLKGSAAIKKRGTRYLPQPNPTDTSPANELRYRDYLKRAVWLGVTQRTHDGMLGLVYDTPPIVNVPDGVIDIENVNGQGLSLVQHSRSTCSYVLSYGRAGLLVDYPATDGPVTVAAAADNEPTFTLYRPEDVINWRTDSGGLSLVVLRECYVKADDGFEEQTESQYRVLRMVEGAYQVQLYREGEMVEEYWPTDSSGKNWDEITFTFVGSMNNDADIDQPPLEPITDVNIAHYRNSADQEEASFIVGQPTVAVVGVSKDWGKSILGGELQIGSRGLIPLPVGASIELLQPSPNTLPGEGMKDKKDDLIALGAKLIEGSRTTMTATEVNADSQTNNSVLTSIADNVSMAYQSALEWAALFSGASGTIEFELNTDFDAGIMSAQERQQLLAEYMGGGISWDEYRAVMKRGGIASEDDDIVASQVGVIADADVG